MSLTGRVLRGNFVLSDCMYYERHDTEWEVAAKTHRGLNTNNHKVISLIHGL